MKQFGMSGIAMFSKFGSVTRFALFALAVVAACSTGWSQTTYPTQIGVEVQDHPTGFVDALKDQGRLFQDTSGNAIPTDANGNPTTDGIIVVFDNRPFPEFLGYSDDPAADQPDCSGTYLLSFQGQATLANVAASAAAPTLTFANQAYNSATNTTTVNVTLPGGPNYSNGAALMEISFTNTQRTATSATNTGITGLQVIRPGFTASQIFDPAFVKALAPFSHLRVMNWLGTNTNPGYYGDTGHHLIGWTSRSLPTDFYQGVGTTIRAGAWGVSWEYILQLANAANKDIWINIPISATGGSDALDPTYVASPDTSSYIYNLAYFLKNGNAFTGNKGLNPGLHIYIEHSNEVWNSGFLQYTWNSLAAQDEVSKGGSPLNNDGDTSQYDWAYRRHIKRLYEISQIFQSVFGTGSLNTTIRPVYAWWQLDEGSGSNAANALAWFKNTYGPPSNYFYAMAQGDYFAATNYANDTTIPEVLSDMQASSNSSVQYVVTNKATASQYGLPLFVYEGGPDNSNGGSGSTTNIGVEIQANRDPGMNTLVQSHIRSNWFGQSTGNFSYFNLSGSYSRYGSWGATDDYRNLATEKYEALLSLTGYTQATIPSAPANLVAKAGNQTVALTWQSVSGAASYNVKRGVTAGGEGTTSLATVSSPAYSDNAVTNGSTYYYVVTAVNSSGESTPSNEVSATPEPTTPPASTLTATSGNGQATLSWTTAAGATSYNVYEGTSAGNESVTPIATGVTMTTYTASSLTNGKAYYFEVRGVNSVGTGSVSNEVTVTPAGPPSAPAGLTAASGSGQAVLSWTASSGATSYNVYRGTTSGGEGSTAVATGITATTYTSTGLTSGTTYYFKVAAVNQGGVSGYSNEATATPTSSQTSGLLAYEPFGEATGALNGASGSGDSGWGAAWSEQYASTTIPGYNIVSTTPMTYSGLLTNGNYAIGGYSYQSAGRQLDISATGAFSSYLSGGSIGAAGKTIWVSFLLREDVSPSNGQNNAVYLNPASGSSAWLTNAANTLGIGYFGSSSNNASGNPFWSLQFNGSTTVQTTVPVVQGQTTLFVVGITFAASGGQNQVNLYVNPTSLSGAAPATPSAQFSTSSTVAFQSISYEGGYSTNESSLDEIRLGNSFAAVTPGPALAAPAGLAATAGNAQAVLKWSASPGAASYNVYRGTASGGESTTPMATGITATTYTATGLTNNTAYYFKVTAVSGSSVSGYSNEATATPSSSIASGPATPVTIPNYSFEADQQASYIVPQSWNFTNTGDSAVQQISSNTINSPPYPDVDGTYYWSPTVNNSSTAPFGSGTATLTTASSLGTFAANAQYALTVALGTNGNTSDLSTYQVGFQLLANGLPVASFVAPTSGTSAIPPGSAYTGPNGLADYSLTFNTASQPQIVGQNLTVALVYTYTGQYGRAAYFDNVRLTQTGASGGVAVPSAPTNVTATAGSGRATLVWAPVTGAASYNVYQGTTSGGEVTPVSTGITGSSYSATNLINGTEYYFVVAAVNSTGVSSNSTEVNVTPQASLGIPAAPMVTAAAGDMQVTLSWTAVPGASSYNIYEAVTTGGEGATPIATGVTASSYVAAALTDGTQYYFKVSAVNTYGASILSNEVAATPKAAVAGTNAPADFSVYPQVLATKPLPAGFNMAPSAGTNIGENAWLADGGFNSYETRLSLTADQPGTSTTFVSESAAGGTSYYQSIVSGFFVGATARTYRYSSGAWALLRTDTVAAYTANGENPTATNSTITFANSGPATQSGDIIWLDLDNQPIVPNVSKLDPRFTTYFPTWQTETQSGQSRTTTWPYTLSSDVPATDAGGLSLEISDTATETNGIWQYMQGAFVGSADEEFQSGHTYEVDLWLKQSGVNNGSVTFSISGLGISHTFTGVTGSWQHFTWTFPAVAGLPANSVQPSIHLDFSAPGTMWVDNFQLYDAAWAPNTVSPQVMQSWQNYQPGTVRIWSNFGNSSSGYSFWSLDSWLTPEIKSRNSPGIGNEYAVSAPLEHLPDALANVKTIGGGAVPWLIVNMALSETEWGELIDYLSAPAGTGYAAKRPAGHPGPYTADFSTIYLEVGNEEWGTQQVPADTAYGQWAHFMLSQAIAGKSYFNPSQIKFVANGFFLNPSFGSAAITAAPEATVVDNALYSSGNSALTGDAYYQSDLIQVPATNGPIIDSIVQQQQLDAAAGKIYSLAAYEEGPGTDTTAGAGDTTLAAAIGAIDVNLYASQRGFGPQNFFQYSMGTGPWTSHSNFANGFRPHPVWEALQMRNNYCSGPIVLTTVNSVPTTTDGNAYPLIAVYTFQDAKIANQADVVVISRDLNNQTPVTLHFPATPTGSAQLYTLTGDPRAGNDNAMTIPIGSQQVSVTANYTFSMPPGSMYIFQVPMTGAWSSSGVPAPPAPTSLSASAGNASVILTWSPSNGATGYTVQRGTISGGPYTTIASPSSITYTDTAVTNGTTYYYVVTATNTGGSSALSVEANATPNVGDAKYAAAAPPLDGTSGGSWANTPFISLGHSFAGTSTDSAQYKTLWDANYLYVLVSVLDSTLVAPTETNVFVGDSVEVYFSGTDNRSTTYGPTDFQYSFPYGNGGAVATEADHSPSSLTGVIFAEQPIAGGYQITVALPWTTLGTSPVSGKQYGFDVMINDANSQGNRIGKLAWWGTADQTWHNPSLMGPLVLLQNATQSQTITFAPVSSPVTYGSSPITLSATGGGSANSVIFSLTSGPGTLSGNNNSVLTIAGAGTLVVAANQAGNTGYAAATQKSQSIVVNQAPLTVTAASVSRAVGSANPTFSWTYGGLVNGDTAAVVSGSPVLSTTATTSSAAGTYPIVVAKGTLAASNYLLTLVNGTLSVVAAPTVVITTTAILNKVSNTYVATVKVTNTGTGPAANVQLTTASLGTAAGTPLSQSIGTLAAGTYATVNVTYPSSAGADGTTVIEKYSGTYTGGSFSGSIRAALP